VNASARRQLAARGLNTGAFGIWLGRQRILVRTLVAVLAVIWLFALRPVSLGDVALVLIVSFGAAWILELLQRRPDELNAASAGVPVTAGAQGDDAVAPDAETTVVAASGDAPLRR
jgi:hypothetical protein